MPRRPRGACWPPCKRFGNPRFWRRTLRAADVRNGQDRPCQPTLTGLVLNGPRSWLSLSPQFSAARYTFLELAALREGEKKELVGWVEPSRNPSFSPERGHVAAPRGDGFARAQPSLPALCGLLTMRSFERGHPRAQTKHAAPKGGVQSQPKLRGFTARSSRTGRRRR
jgi:hypothetical protein